MTDFIKELAVNLFNNPTLATIFISMFPVIEVKGAIPFAQSRQIWGSNALSSFSATVFALLGSFIISIVLLVTLKLLFNYLKSKPKFNTFMQKIKNTFINKTNKVEGKTELKTFILLFIFVAIPLPLTGVWSGCLIASLLDLDILKSLLTITVGNICAAGIIALISKLSGDLSLLIFYFFVAAFVIIIIYYLIKIFIINKKYKV